MNKKIIIGLLAIVAVLIGGGFVWGRYSIPKKNIEGGIQSTNLNWYQSATSTSVVCNGSASTLILATATAGYRRDFNISLLSTSTPITLCKAASGCSIGQGYQLSVSSTVASYEQNDGYYGSYSCIGNAGSSTIGVFVSQQ